MKENQDPLLKEFIQDRLASPESFRRLVKKYEGLVYQTCLRMLHSHEDAEDATQAVFMVLAQKAKTVHGNLNAFLHKTAVYICIRMIKSKVSRTRREQIIGAASNKTDSDPSKSAESIEARFILDELIERLPKKERDVIILHALQGQTLDQTAEQLRMPAGTVTWLYQRSLKKLRNAMKKRDLHLPALLLIHLFKKSSSHLPQASTALSDPMIDALSQGVTTSNSAFSFQTITHANQAMQSILWERVGSLSMTAALVGISFTVPMIFLQQTLWARELPAVKVSNVELAEKPSKINKSTVIAPKEKLNSEADRLVEQGWNHTRGMGVDVSYEKAKEYFSAAVKLGSLDGEHALAWLQWTGRGEKEDEPAAFLKFQALARKGHLESRCVEAWSYSWGAGVKKDLKKGLALFNEAAARNYAGGWHGLGVHYYQGWAVKKNLTLARENLQKSAEAGYMKGQQRLGKFLIIEGKGKEQPAALEWFKKSAAQGYFKGQYSLAKEILFDYPRTPEKGKKVVALLLKSAHQGYDHAQYMLAKIYQGHYGSRFIRPDREKSFSWYKMAASAGHYKAQANLAVEYISRRKHKEARHWAKKGAEGGSAYGMANYGMWLFWGDAGRRDRKEGVRWLKKAAENERPFSIHNYDDFHHDFQFGKPSYTLALAYGRGLGVKRDQAKALGYAERAAKVGYPQAINVMVNTYSFGDNPEFGFKLKTGPDAKKALKWMRFGAERNILHSLAMLGYAYSFGKGVAKDYKKAVEYTRKSTVLRSGQEPSALGMRNLGVFYANGQGVTKDLKEARKWFVKAAGYGDKQAVGYLKQVDRDIKKNKKKGKTRPKTSVSSSQKKPAEEEDF